MCCCSRLLARQSLFFSRYRSPSPSLTHFLSFFSFSRSLFLSLSPSFPPSPPPSTHLRASMCALTLRTCTSGLTNVARTHGQVRDRLETRRREREDLYDCYPTPRNYFTQQVMPYMYALYMYAIYVCLICMPYMYTSLLFLRHYFTQQVPSHTFKSNCKKK